MPYGVVHKIRTQHGGEGGSLEKHMKAYGGGGGGVILKEYIRNFRVIFRQKIIFLDIFPQI